MLKIKTKLYVGKPKFRVAATVDQRTKPLAHSRGRILCHNNRKIVSDDAPSHHSGYETQVMSFAIATATRVHNVMLIQTSSHITISRSTRVPFWISRASGFGGLGATVGKPLACQRIKFVRP